MSGRTTFEEMEGGNEGGEEELMSPGGGFAGESRTSPQRTSPQRTSPQRTSPRRTSPQQRSSSLRTSPLRTAPSGRRSPPRTTPAGGERGTETRRSVSPRQQPSTTAGGTSVTRRTSPRVARRPLGPTGMEGAGRMRTPEAAEPRPEFISGSEWRKREGMTPPRRRSVKRPQKHYKPGDKISVLRVAYGRCREREDGKFVSGELNQDCVWEEVRKLLEETQPDLGDDEIEDEIDRLRESEGRKKSGRKETPESRNERRLRQAAKALLQPRTEEGGRKKFLPAGRKLSENELQRKVEELRAAGWLEQHREGAARKGIRMDVGGEYVSVARSASQRARKKLADELGVDVRNLGRYDELTDQERRRLDELKDQEITDLMSGKEKKQPPSRRAGSRKKSEGKREGSAGKQAQKRTVTRPASPRR